MGKFQKLKNFFQIFILFAMLFVSCAKPTVVNVALPEDEKLNCKKLDDQVMEAQKIKREAILVSDQTGANVARTILFWPSWVGTLHNADKAISAADDRTYHLYKIMRKKDCKEANKVRYFITDKRKNIIGISKELKALKKLYEAGDLTEEEYTKAKKKVIE
tara:strand:- start:386 stop:868 length:483 start_codon:yes stop_codon:yes gene_type:complete